MTNTHSQSSQDTQASVLESGEDLARKALAESTGEVTEDAEIEASDKMAETLTTLQNLIEQRANALEDIKEKLKDHRTSLRDIMENDPALSEVKAEMETHFLKVKERKSQLQSTPESMSLKVKISELREEQKELEETLSNHLVNYHSLTHSNSFDTSDGDQWEFSIKAKIKPRKRQNEDQD